jgi:formylglycine-generating enzyme required for sulfatase activity
MQSLASWKERHPQIQIPPAPGDPETYLQSLQSDTAQIRIMKLKSKRAEPYAFDIDEIYIPLTTLAPLDETKSRKTRKKSAQPELHQRRTVLEHAITQRKVVLIGDPGSGKSTFLKRITFELCRNIQGTRPKDAKPFLSPDDRRFPLLIRTADLTKLLAADKSPKPPDAPDWLPYFLSKQSEYYKFGLDESFFRRKLDEGGCLVMVDGLDEAPDQRLRERVSRIFEKATVAYAKCDFLVTTRPQSYSGDSVLAGFFPIRIGDLEPPEIKTFFRHFSQALLLPANAAQEFQESLESALERRAEIREMARNPVMLTALAVLQHNDQKLPEYRVELYESILGWLASARDAKDGRPTAEKCLEYLRKLALAMQEAPAGRMVQMNKRAAAELAASEWGGTIEHNENVLELETQDSGILSAAGTDLKFWHLSFQEYLAARELASFSDEQLLARVVKSQNLYHPEWREMLRLLGGILKQQGVQKVDGFFNAVLATVPAGADLERRTRCAALLSSMLRDLKPMGYQPTDDRFDATIKSVMQIFEPGPAQKIDIKTRVEAADLLGQVGDPRLDDHNWVEIQGGTFWMGAQKTGRNEDPEAYEEEAPVHQVTLKSFRIGRFPVTVQEFARFLKASGYAKQKFWEAGGFQKFTEPEEWESQKRFPNRPVVGVSWFEASAYCAWAALRLPTEAEWERVARGPNSARHPWGDAPALDHSRANYEIVVGHPTPVGLFPEGNSTEDICDLLGNVWEWCSDWYAGYSDNQNENPAGLQKGDLKVLRGGAWIDGPGCVRVSVRDGGGPADRYSNVGFRCAT